MRILKKIYILIILFVFSTEYAQNIKVEVEYYQAIINKEITKSDKPKILKDLDYVLQFTRTESLFYNIPRMESDGYRSNSRYTRKAGAMGIFYNNLKTKEKYHAVTVLGKKFLVKSPLNQYKWVLTKVTKKIDKYLCHKAYYVFTNPKFPNKSIIITAWYSKELPFPFGPVGYGGLPGLILELDYLDYAFAAKKITFNKDFEIVRPKGNVVSSEELRAYFLKKTGVDVDKKFKEREKKEKKRYY